MNLIIPIFVISILTWPRNDLHVADAQCLSDNDNLSQGGSTDLSGILEFNLDLFRNLVPTDHRSNFIFSPYSIWNALVLAYFGSRGNTEQELKKVLRVGDKVTTLKNWRRLEYMYAMRPETTVNNTFVVANKAFFNESVAIRHCMEDILHNELQKLNFNKPKEAVRIINDFVSKTTEGAIERLVSVTDVNDVLLVLANAAYFKGIWSTPFDRRDTKPKPFFGFDGAEYTVNMMTQIEEFKYAYDDSIGAEYVEIPYSGNAISMFIFLPYNNTAKGLNNMIKKMNPTNFEKALKKMFKTKITLGLPKFSQETQIGDELITALSKMGLRVAFTRRAQFTDFSYNKEISLEKSIHKAYIDVYEEGTEAAAATAIIATKILGSAYIEFNRPFLFLIRDNDTKNLLFIGTYVVPEGTKTIRQEPSHPVSETQPNAGSVPVIEQVSQQAGIIPFNINSISSSNSRVPQDRISSSNVDRVAHEQPIISTNANAAHQDRQFPSNLGSMSSNREPLPENIKHSTNVNTREQNRDLYAQYGPFLSLQERLVPPRVTRTHPKESFDRLDSYLYRLAAFLRDSSFQRNLNNRNKGVRQ